MPTRPTWPDDHEPAIDVVPALGRFEDLTTMVGTRMPGAGSCWCMSYRDSRASGDARPAFMAAECERSPGPGILLYVDDVVAGWCSVAPRDSYRRLLNSRTIPVGDEPDLWCVVCFVVRAGFRKRGLMHRLLAGAVAHAADAGAAIIEGYPVETGGSRVDVVSGYVGTVESFERAGFTRRVATTGRSGGRPRWVMRLDVTRSGP